MQSRNVPATGPRYWAALCLASVAGANLGDLASHSLHLGHWRGLAPLALLFAIALLAERRAARGGEVCYWAAILTLRTAATNLGDLATHDFGLSFPVCCIVLAGLLAALVARAGRQGPRRLPGGVPVTDGWYWAAMLTAGTLGTVAGDYCSDTLGSTALSSALLGAAVALCLGLRVLPGFAGAAGYWLTVTAIRTAGTAVGDWAAFRHGLDLGLPVSSAVSLAAMAAVLLLSPRRSARDA